MMWQSHKHSSGFDAHQVEARQWFLLIEVTRMTFSRNYLHVQVSVRISFEGVLSCAGLWESGLA